MGASASACRAASTPTASGAACATSSSACRPRDLGFIIRTAGEGTREADLEADVRYLTKVWDEIQIRKDQVRAPAVLYSEPVAARCA